MKYITNSCIFWPGICTVGGQYKSPFSEMLHLEVFSHVLKNCSLSTGTTTSPARLMLRTQRMSCWESPVSLWVGLVGFFLTFDVRVDV